MFEYGLGYFEQNDVALHDMRDAMSDAAVALAESMAEQEVVAEDECADPE